MRRATQTRFHYSDAVTLSWFTADDLDKRIYILENPWLRNMTDISCIPEGIYDAVPDHFNAGGYDTIGISPVPGRTHILFHKGNTVRDTDGCPLVGLAIGRLHGEIAVLDSTFALECLLAWFDGERFQLTIKALDV